MLRRAVSRAFVPLAMNGNWWTVCENVVACALRSPVEKHRDTRRPVCTQPSKRPLGTTMASYYLVRTINRSRWEWDWGFDMGMIHRSQTALISGTNGCELTVVLAEDL